MSKVIDMCGSIYGRLTVLDRDGSDREGKAVWKCSCSCGNVVSVRGKHLRSGAVRSCGCLSAEINSENRKLRIDGMKFNRLTAIREVPERQRGLVRWEFQCDCGNTLVAPAARVKSGNTKSCGCLQPETAVMLATSHGLARTPTYNSWAGMLYRCNNPSAPNYKHYGGRGISVHLEWLSFENFLCDMGLRPEGTTLGRIDNDLSYNPSNCRWETIDDQSLNKRSTIYVVFEDEVMPVTTACELSGVDRSSVAHMVSHRKRSYQEAFDILLYKHLTGR